MTDLSTLLARVEAGSGADGPLDAALNVRFGLFYQTTLTTDLNAVVALVEARRPGWLISIAKMAPDRWEGSVLDNEGSFLISGDTERYGTAPTPARALLAALLRAEMEKVG